MDLLQQARAEIDTVDAEMAALFERRMRAVADVVRYKAETGKPVFDAAREAAVLDKNTARITDEALRPYYRAFLSDAMSISRAYQRARLGRDTAAYQGVPGAWSHIALRRLFPFARETACTTWGEVFDAVQNGDAQFGVLPFENSNAGDVSTVLDLLYTHPDIIIARMCDLPIRQDLLGVPGATLETVRTVISHPQALAQSSVFVQHGAYLREVSDTLVYIFINNSFNGSDATVFHCHDGGEDGGRDAGSYFQGATGFGAVANHSCKVGNHVLNGKGYLFVSTAHEPGNAATGAGGGYYATA